MRFRCGGKLRFSLIASARALAWTEAVTLVGKDHVPDEVFELARSQFSEKELVDLTLAIVAINSWNRLAISFRAVPGSYHRPAEMKTGTR